MMTRKHFQAFAEAIAKIRDGDSRRLVCTEVAKVCGDSNPRFNIHKFNEACYCHSLNDS